VVGTPGSGKTRFIAEVLKQPHPSMAEHFPNYLHLHATYNNGNDMTDLDKKAPARCFALRMLYHYFMEGDRKLHLEVMLNTLCRATECLDHNSFTVKTALQLIREDYIERNKLERDSGQHCRGRGRV
jgi:hypothetical protein